MTTQTVPTARPVAAPVAYPAPTEKWAKHARKRCIGCGVPLQGKYWLLDQWSWACTGCGSDALKRNAVVRGGS